MEEIALGWLGWSEEQTLSADINAILVGHAGKIGFLEAAGFVERINEPEKSVEPLSAVAWLKSTWG